MAPQNVNVVFVPGAWHSPDGYDAVIAHLHKVGYKTSKVYTPSVVKEGGSPIANTGEDIAEIRKSISAAVDAGEKVVLVMHSYGGAPGSEAVEGLDAATLASQGHRDGRGVVHLVYIASFMMPKGECLFSLPTGGEQWIQMRDDGTQWPSEPAYRFYNDFESQEEVDRWISLLRPHSAGTGLSVAQNQPWKTISTTYIACLRDNAIPVAFQKGFVRSAIEAGAVDMRLLVWDCGHTPFAVRPLDVSRVIRAAAGDIEILPAKASDVKTQTTQVVTREVSVQ